ncbi:MAG: restriction endonuclease subunit R [Planctomycetaceae bacterium]|nr:restriction endonuclease subunit R [Planctomycetaceae bacterium]MBL38688.1 restriction endonuclease subunit R [Xanthomonadales bacterium]|tara:strand:+ start:4021 stop:7203 length:3183 start_codon:yes stop_codon:yes gene_type:complete
MADSREQPFQQEIVDAMCAVDGGWKTGPASGYDRERALYSQDLIDYFQEAHPDQWERFARQHPREPEQALLNATVRELDKKGALHVLRHGFKVPAARVSLCSFKPDHGMNPEAEAGYRANRLRVVQEVSYSPHHRQGEYNPRLDLVLFVNGIPTATLELKSEFQQSVERAKRQYRRDRPPKDPKTRRPEPLLTFGRGALVHFAVSQFEVAMTTRLAGNQTFFLPFNKGQDDGAAGNPPPPDENSYATDYLWQEVFAPDAWLKILGRYLHMQEEVKEDFHGRKVKTRKLIFPRYHQWDAVKRLLAATREEGAGKRYLVQHSAGSGKSNSIAWLAHQLASLYAEDGQKLFNSVVVITDRTVLDSQLQQTIDQFEHATGVVRPISREIDSAAKSAQLAEALAERARIIVVTIQTFPALYEALSEHEGLAAGRYAVIADEAHSSQTGLAASKLRAILGSDFPEGEEISAEEMLDAAVSARGPTDRISYYAFTATPKARTLELFGRPPNPELPRAIDNRPVAFHVYSMRQAIEEGFILDVLRQYVTYSTAWKLTHPDADETEVESRKARRELARWVRLHPYNIGQKVEVIVEHFREHVRPMLDGQAKAMVVTSSRPEAVRYALAMRKYVTQAGYDDVHPLVAFSGSVGPDEAIPEEVTETSKLLNPGLKGRDHAEAFKTDEYNVMIAANKFQTGFDQPKLCAMYVDKKLAGVDCVQTLSRLNRTFPGKEQTFILDFVNDAEDVLEAFRPYYRTAELADVSDPQVVYDLQHSLDQAGIYRWEEVAAFAKAFFDPKAPASSLSYHCQPARDRFQKRYRLAVEQQRQWLRERKEAERAANQTAVNRAESELKDAGAMKDELDLFRKNLQSFVRTYEFLSQIVNFDDPELEQLNVYARHLHPLLRIDRLDEDEIDIHELELTHYRLSKRAEVQLKLGEGDPGEGLNPVTEVGSGKPHDPEKERLSEIIEQMNELFGAEVREEDQLHFLRGIANRMEREEDVMEQIRTNSAEQVMHGRYPSRLNDLLLEAIHDNEQLSTDALKDQESFESFALILLRYLNRETGAKPTLL